MMADAFADLLRRLSLDVPSLANELRRLLQLRKQLERVYEADFGDGVATSFDFPHAFGTYALFAIIWDNATRTKQVLAVESMPDLNTYRVSVAIAPTSKQLHILIGRARG